MIARTCDINANVLSNWVRLHERGMAGGASVSGDVIEMPAASAFLAVQVDPAPQPPSAAPRLEVQIGLPNRVTVNVHVMNDLDGPARFIEVLGRLRCSASTKP